jgi:hypothetical protein
LSRSPRAEVARATGWGFFVATLILAGIYAGSRRLRDFDPALVPYAGASVFSAFGLAYRYSMWLTKPPTRLYWRRGWRLFFAPSQVVANLSRLTALFAVNIVAQRFIEKRSPLRCAAHWCLAWGCVLAARSRFRCPSVGCTSRPPERRSSGTGVRLRRACSRSTSTARWRRWCSTS